MKQITIIILLAIMSLSISSCRKVEGEGPVVSETRNASGFSGVAISVPADVVYTQAPTYNVELKAQRNILDQIESPVVNGELRLRFKRNLTLRSFDRVIIHISSPDIYSLSISGSGKIEVPASINTARMRLAVSGSGDINIDSLKSADNIETVISGSGDITVRRGSSVRADILVSGSGKVNMDGVVTNSVDANISGSGNVRVNAVQTLKARISGSGDVYYRGTPSITSNVSGSGKIIKL
jgi:predicted small secreted protein